MAKELPPLRVTLTKARVLADLRRARDAKGKDYVDPKALTGGDCQYATSRGAPMCIVGHVLDYEGVNLKPIWNSGSVDELWLDPAVTVIADGVLEFVAQKPRDILRLRSDRSVGITRQALKALEAAQNSQDTGETWGDAVAMAYIGGEV